MNIITTIFGVLCLTLAISSQAVASVVYDVEVDYTAGYTYSFTMEFASVKNSYTEVDLVGGDFTNEAFSQSGTPWSLDIDNEMDAIKGWTLSFDSLTSAIDFLTADRFESPSNPPNYTFILRDEKAAFISGVDQPVVDVRVEKSSVPAPAAISLFGLGLVGMLVMRKRGTRV
jgi:hypothetical protein